MLLPLLYSRTSTGAVQTWTIQVLDNAYRTTHGQLGGQLQITDWTVCEGKNIGRANETSPEQQAQAEAKALWQKKVDTGYFENINDIDVSNYVEPMLANKWEDHKHKIQYPVYCQPKLDGLRCIISKDKNGFIVGKSRKGKVWVTIPHIINELEPLFERYPNLILDGELYNHKYHDDFNKITSLVKKTKPSKDDLTECEKYVQFHWYDTASSDHTFRQRTNWIKTLSERFNFADCIQIVPTHKAHSLEELDEYYGEYLDNNYEGQMVRVDAPYSFKRTSNLLKRKEFQEEDFPIVAFEEGRGNRAGTVGAVVLNCNGELFKAPLNGTLDYCKEVWDNRESYIGAIGSVKYFNLTPPPRCVPRFGKVKAIRDYE